MFARLTAGGETELAARAHRPDFVIHETAPDRWPPGARTPSRFRVALQQRERLASRVETLATDDTQSSASARTSRPLLDWSGSVLVATEGDRRGPVLTPGTRRQALPRGSCRSRPVQDLRAAGSSVASSTTVSRAGETEDQLDARIDVGGLDGKPAYSVTAEDSFIEDFALQDDGKVAWLQRRNVEAARVAVAWASPAEPWAHVVARDVAIGGVPIGHDRIPFGRQVRRGLGSWQPWIADLAGVARPTWFALAAPFGRMRAASLVPAALADAGGGPGSNAGCPGHQPPPSSGGCGR